MLTLGLLRLSFLIANCLFVAVRIFRRLCKQALQPTLSAFMLAAGLGGGSAPENRRLAALSLAEPLMAGALWEGLTLAGGESEISERPSASGAASGAGPSPLGGGEAKKRELGARQPRAGSRRRRPGRLGLHPAARVGAKRERASRSAASRAADS